MTPKNFSLSRNLRFTLISDPEERDRAMLAETAVRQFFDKLNGPIGRTLTKKQLVESMVSLK